MSDEKENLLAYRYRLISKMDSDNIMDVWYAVDVELDNAPVIVSKLPKAVLSSGRVYQQVKAAMIESLKLLHSNIASIRSLHDNAGEPFFISDFTEGQPLNRCLDEWGKLTVEEAKALLTPLASAIDYAHGRGVVHCDIRPSNVLVRVDGSPCLCNFCTTAVIRGAIAQVSGGNATGSISYMSPEQLTGSAPAIKQDIYSFAAIAYECLMGHPPFHRGQLEYQIVNVNPEPIPDNSPFAKAIMRALSKDPSKRPETCADIIAGDLPKLQEPAPEPVPAPIPRRRHHSHRHSSTSHRSLPPALRPRINTRHRDDIDDEITSSFWFRVKYDNFVKSGVVVATLMFIVIAIICFISDRRPAPPVYQRAESHSTDYSTSTYIDAARYAKFHGIEFGKVYSKLPAVGANLGYGVVTAHHPGGHAFDVKLRVPLYRVFQTATIRLSDSDGGQYVSSVQYMREDGGINPEKAKNAVIKLAELLGKDFKVNLGKPEESTNNSYFSLRHRDQGIEIRVSCAVSQESTSLFISIENLFVSIGR